VSSLRKTLCDVIAQGIRSTMEDEMVVYGTFRDKVRVLRCVSVTVCARLRRIALTPLVRTA
jgi:hypothetical protein